MSLTKYGEFLDKTSHVTISRYENNPSFEPEKEFLQVVSRRTNTSIEFLANIAYPNAVRGFDPQILQFAEILKFIPEQDRELILSAAKRLIKYNVEQPPQDIHPTKRKRGKNDK